MKLIACLALALLAALPATLCAAPADPASAVVSKFLDARAAGSIDAAYAFIINDTSGHFNQPKASDVANVVAHFDDPKTFGPITPEFRALIALLTDFQNKLHYKFRVLGPAPDAPHIVLLRAYRVGTPLSTIIPVRIVLAPDPAVHGALRIDMAQTIMRTAPDIGPARGNAKQAQSLSNEKQISLGILLYAQDHDEHYPDADKWVDEIMPYVKSEAVFHDPSAPDSAKWSYAFNRNLSGAKLADAANPSATVMIFESTTGTKNASDTGASIPHPGRHPNGTAYGFADGHCKLLPDSAPAPSFLLAAP